MKADYFKKTKKQLEKQIPESDTEEFDAMGEKIRQKLQEKEEELKFIRGQLRVLILADWKGKVKKARLTKIKEKLLDNDIFTRTIDEYYDIYKSTGLTQVQVLETCCPFQSLIIFIDGESTGTLTEQNYLAPRYGLHKKMLFFIEKSKFDELKNKPNEYINSFPAIIPYEKSKLVDDVLAYGKLRIYRFANIIKTQEELGLGRRRRKRAKKKEISKG